MPKNIKQRITNENKQLKIYNQYAKYGIHNYYSQFSDEYYNPHADKITTIYNRYLATYLNNALLAGGSILDIACGDGLITRIIKSSTELNNINDRIKGCDPYFVNKYVNYPYSFEDIALGLTNYELKGNFKVAICCYAFHLLDNSWYYAFFNGLAELITDRFIIITPSKKISISHPKWIIEQQIRDTTTKISIVILCKT